MTALEQLRSELRATERVLDHAADVHERAAMRGECEYLREAIAFQERLEALASREVRP